MKVLIKYTDWLILNRGEIKPEVGDELCFIYNDKINRGLEIYTINNEFINTDIHIDICYVEIDYNPNESVEFLTWYLTSDITNKELSTGLPQTGEKFNLTKYLEELYQQFLKERNENR